MGPRSRTVRISEDVFKRLQKLARPLDDTPNSVIERLLDYINREPDPVLGGEGQESHDTVDEALAPSMELLQAFAMSEEFSEGWPEAPVVDDDTIGTKLDWLQSSGSTETRVILAPAAKTAQQQYEESVKQSVSLARLKPLLSEEECRDLMQLYPDGQVQVWGARSGPRNRKNFARIKVGDVVLFYRDSRYFSSYQVTKKLDRSATELAKELWGTDSDGHAWDLIYFLSDGRDENIKVGELGKIAGQGPRTLVRGLWILDRAPSTRVIKHFELAR